MRDILTQGSAEQVRPMHLAVNSGISNGTNEETEEFQIVKKCQHLV